MDEDKKDDNEKAGSSQEAEEKRDTVTVSNSNSSIDFLVNQPRKSGDHFGKRNIRMPKQKKKKRATGRVQKRKPRRMRRKARPRYKVPRPPISDTSFSSKNTLSISHADITCRYCGHRCCLRRYMEEKRRLNKRSTYRKVKKERIQERKESHSCKTTASATCQMGAPSVMFSKLFVGGSPMTAENPGYADHYKEISPEMIYHSLHDMTMWREAIPTMCIFKFIRKRYPINPNTNEAVDELLLKLRVAQITGIAWALPNDCWRLTTALERVHRLDMNHVTLFWKTYWNTMKPLDRNRQNCVSRSDKKVTTEEENLTDRFEII